MEIVDMMVQRVSKAPKGKRAKLDCQVSYIQYNVRLRVKKRLPVAPPRHLTSCSSS